MKHGSGGAAAPVSPTFPAAIRGVVALAGVDTQPVSSVRDDEPGVTSDAIFSTINAITVGVVPTGLLVCGSSEIAPWR